MTRKKIFKWIFRKDGQTKPLLEWCRIHGRDYSAACKMARKGYSIDKILKPRHGALRGGKSTKSYRVWLSMRLRCKNPNDKVYRNVKICKRWSEYSNFLQDMGEPPTIQHQIDRINNKKGYSKENCRWVTPTENSRNRKNNIFLHHNGKSQTAIEWALELGIKPSTLYGRLRSGWDTKRALSPAKF